MTVRTLAVAILMLIAGVSSCARAHAEATGDWFAPDQPAPDSIESGAHTYAFHCAACHGRDGKGNGPVAETLRQKPTDLTTLTRRHKGRFHATRSWISCWDGEEPFVRTARAEMPVWGPLFRELNPYDSRIDVRAARLVNHLESLQVRITAG